MIPECYLFYSLHQHGSALTGLKCFLVVLGMAFMWKLKLHLYFINGSDHEVVACYLELYDEGEVEHIKGTWPILLKQQLYLQLKIKF